MSTNYTYYLPGLCERTSSILLGLIQLSINVPMNSLSYSIGILEEQMPTYFLIVLVSFVLLLILTGLCMWGTYRQKIKVRTEVLSLDSVANLYSISEYQPYLNKIYYS